MDLVAHSKFGVKVGDHIWRSPGCLGKFVIFLSLAAHAAHPDATAHGQLFRRACELRAVGIDAAVLSRMGTVRIDVQAIMYSVFVSACEMGGRWGKASAAIIDTVMNSCIAVIGACDQGWSVGGGVGSFEHHGRGRKDVNRITYNVSIMSIAIAIVSSIVCMHTVT